MNTEVQPTTPPAEVPTGLPAADAPASPLGQSADPQPPAPAGAVVASSLEDLTLEQIKSLRVVQLRALCQAAGLPARVHREQMVASLVALKLGGQDGYVPGHTLCEVCGSPGLVMGTRRQSLADGSGRVVVTRSFRCEGRQHHTYPIRQMEARK
jgi:hypothetical protein